MVTFPDAIIFDMDGLMLISLQGTGLRSRFDTVITVDQTGVGKPAPDIFLTAAKTLNVSPSNCLVLEDSNAGIQAAITAGINAILVPDLQIPTAYAQQHALAIMSSLYEVLEHLQRLAVHG